MGNERVEKVVLDLDNKEFVKKLKDSLGLMGQLGNVDGLKDLGSMFLKIGAVAGVAAGAILAVKTAINLTEQAEEIKQVNQAFDAMAENAGVAADAIRDQLVGAAKGLADDEEILKAATKSMSALGEEAKRLPEIMEFARKATNLYGGDLVGNFEAMSNALAAGNTRALKQFGIIIDNDKAMKDYAKSIGTSVEFLTDAAKKQAIMNAALEQAREKFKGVDESTTQTSQNMRKMSVSLGEIKDAALLAWDAIAGPTVRKATSNLAEAFHTLAVKVTATFGQGQEKADAINESLQKQIKLLTVLRDNTSKAFNPGEWENLNNQLKIAEAKMQKINDADERSMMLAMKKQQAESDPSKKQAEEKAAKPQIDYEKLKEARAKFENDLLALHQARLASEQEINTSVERARELVNEQQKQVQAEADIQAAALKREFYDKGIIDEAAYQQARTEIYQNATNKILELERQADAEKLKALDNQVKAAQTAAQGFKAAFQRGATEAKMDLTNWGKTGTMVFGSVKNHAVAAFKAMGDGSKSAGEAMRGFMFGAIADTAEAKGTEMLLSGLWPPNPIAIAGGGALIALAQALRSQAEGSSKFSGGGGGGAGGGGDLNGTADDTASQKPELEEQKKKVVSVNIHGSYFETDQTRTRLMDMIREAGDFTDFNLNKIGQS